MNARSHRIGPPLLGFRETRYHRAQTEAGTPAAENVPRRVETTAPFLLMKPLLATLMLSLFPLAGSAQSLPSLVPPATATTPLVEQLLMLPPAAAPLEAAAGSVVPIWSGSNGRLLALVELPPSAGAPLLAGPTTWGLADQFAGGSGVLFGFDNGLHIDALLQHYSAAPRCTGIACGNELPQWNGALAGSLGLGFSPGDGRFDLGYGLSWLQPGERVTPLAAVSTLPTLVLPDMALHAAGPEAELFARGRWRFEQGGGLDLSASYGRGHYAAAGALASMVDLDKLSLSLGIDSGSLRGAIVGHVLSSDDPLLAGRRWTTLDLGVSWRTPWSGELSIGAQNVWSTQSAPNRDNDNQARTPYIQYRQDL